jgi:cell wall-associated NlpC family hydrolase
MLGEGKGSGFGGLGGLTGVRGVVRDARKLFGDAWKLSGDARKSGVVRAARAVRAVLGCGLLVVLSPAAPAGARLEGHPKPPTAAQIKAAENQVRQRQSALGMTQGKLSAGRAELARLQNQAEVLTERYDQVKVNEQRAAPAYTVTQARLQRAERQRAASRDKVAALAAEEFESGGGFDPVTAMIGDAHGPQAYLRQVGMGQVLAQWGTETLAANQANNAVAAVFRSQAHKLLAAQQADLRAANDLKVAIQSAVSRQQTLIKLTEGRRDRLAGQLAAAQARESSLKAARQAALAVQAAAAAERATAAAGSAPSGTQAPSWAGEAGASSAQGDIAASWALSQRGRPYLWGGAGPDSYDCSGLTMMAWARAGVQLLHYTGYQWEEGPHVPLNELQRGDLLFYATNTSDPGTIHHVAIYIGNGMMVNAPHTGAFVRIDSIYAPGGLIGAVRPAG